MYNIREKIKDEDELPGSPNQKVAVLTKIVQHLSPNSKTHMYHLGRPKISDVLCNQILDFIERQDISYCKPGRQFIAVNMKTKRKFTNQNIIYFLHCKKPVNFLTMATQMNMQHIICFSKWLN